MKNIYLLKYSVKGIKALDEWIHLSFYKKTISKNFSIRNYNIKGIYGTNGAGKSGIVTSLKILKSLLIDETYLSNPLVQKQLEEIVNKRTGKVEYEIEFLVKFEDGLRRLVAARDACKRADDVGDAVQDENRGCLADELGRNGMTPDVLAT